MKKILVALALFPLVAHASEGAGSEAISAGTIQVSGVSNLGFIFGQEKVKGGDTTDVTDVSLGLRGAYYLNHLVGVGLAADYSNTKGKIGSYEIGKTDLLVGPMVAIDYPVAEKVSVFGDAFVGYAQKNDTETGVPDEKSTGFGLGLAAGAKYFVVKNFSVDASVGYEWERVKLTEDPKTEKTTSGIGVNFGLSVYFGGK